MFQGSKDAKVLFVSDFLRAKEVEAQEVLFGERKDILVNALSSAGILASDYAMTVIHPEGVRANKITNFGQEQRAQAEAACKALINESKANVIVPLGEYALKFITGLENINKHHLSIYRSRAEFGGRKTISLLHPETIQRSYGDVAYIRFGAMRIRQEMSTTLLNIPERQIKLSLDLPFDEQVSRLESIIRNATEISTDVETGNGQINTVGLATSATEALVLQVTPSGLIPTHFHKLWDLIRQIWESENIGKIAQNGLFEMTWASIYGIRFNNLTFDTMLSMKYLHPTLEKGLGNVGRLYTSYPYWKDDHSDWNNIRDWHSHLTYCGKDACGQFAAKENMVKDLRSRGQLDIFNNFIMPQVPLAFEMMSRGFRLDEGMLDTMRHNAFRDIAETQESFDAQCLERIGRKISLTSPLQVKNGLKEIGLKLPTSKGKETTDKSALMKLKNKYPKEMLIRDMIKLNELKKKTEEYLNFDYDQDGRARFSLDPSSEETGVWGGGKTIFNKGFDPTEVPRIVKNCIVSDSDKLFLEIRLNQPELRYIAQDAPDYKLSGMLREHQDISKYLAGKLFRKNEAMVNISNMKVAAQVMKSANEMHSPKQFIEKCFSRAGIFYSEVEAKRFMQIFFEEFPGCRTRIDDIRKQMYSKRMLKNETRQITYYDRVNDALVRKALAWGPCAWSQEYILSIAYLIKNSNLQVEFICMNKNSLLIQADQETIHKIGNNNLGFVKMYTGNRWGTLEDV